MNVEDLQLHLSNLAQLLDKAGGGKVARDLEEFCLRLQPHRDKKMKDLFDLIDRAEQIVRTGIPPAKTKRSTKPKLDPQQIDAVTTRIVSLYHHAIQPDTTREKIEAAFAELESLNLPAKDLQALARRLDISRKLTKPQAIPAMRQAVLDRKGAWQRVEV